MHLFVEQIEESNEFITIAIFESLCRRLVLSVTPTISNDRVVEFFVSVNCRFRDGSPLDGIISYLTKKHGGHVLDRGIVSITASSSQNPQSYPLRNLADFENQSMFYTQNLPNSWICYDFVKNHIKPTHYSIRSRRDADCDHLRSWILEGSLDAKTWIELDRQENNTKLNGRGGISTFVIPRSSEVRLIRLRQVGKNSTESDFLIVNAIEIFGDLDEPKE
jgi:hypothetical protein